MKVTKLRVNKHVWPFYMPLWGGAEICLKVPFQFSKFKVKYPSESSTLAHSEEEPVLAGINLREFRSVIFLIPICMHVLLEWRWYYIAYIHENFVQNSLPTTFKTSKIVISKTKIFLLTSNIIAYPVLKIFHQIMVNTTFCNLCKAWWIAIFFYFSSPCWMPVYRYPL